MSAALRLFDEGVAFSIDQQHALDAIYRWRAEWPDGRQWFTLGGYAGCLAADTIINVNRAGKGSRMTIEKLAKQFNGEQPILLRSDGVRQKIRPWDLSIPTYVARSDGEVVKLGRVKSVWFSGEKETFTVTTDSGRRIRATSIHPFMTTEGWKTLGELVVGNLVCVNIGRGDKGKKIKPYYPATTTKYHPRQVNGGHGQFKVPTHRAVAEASLNGLGFEEFVDIVRSDPIRSAELNYLPEGYIVHHIDNNSMNASLGNLELLDGQGKHSEVHQWEKNVLWRIGTERIVSTKKYGIEPTYDIEVEDNPHNFLANGFVVHNTGKTTIITSLLRFWKNVSVVAPTGKAVNRLKQVGIEGATTIHGLMYRPWEDAEGKTHFSKQPSIKAVDTLICDEASMVNQYVFNDILSYSKPILFVGDHGQLEPIGENPNLMKDPDVRLEKIHRQAESNPIIRLAAAWREGREQQVFAAIEKKGRWSDAEGKCVVTSRRDFDGYARSGMQLICGFNSTRHRLNNLVRQHRDFGGPTPQTGEKLICLQNNKQFGIFNGQQATVIEAWRPRDGRIDLELELDDGTLITAPCLVGQFGANSIKDHKDRGVALFDFAYCITAHKSQGSEWPGVVVLEEIMGSWNPRRWRYTTTTRASEQLVYCI